MGVIGSSPDRSLSVNAWDISGIPVGWGCAAGNPIHRLNSQNPFLSYSRYFPETSDANLSLQN